MCDLYGFGLTFLKVEKILKGSLDLISSPSLSVKIQIIGWEVYLRDAGGCQQTFCFLKFVDNAQQCFAFTPQANFPIAYPRMSTTIFIPHLNFEIHGFSLSYVVLWRGV